ARHPRRVRIRGGVRRRAQVPRDPSPARGAGQQQPGAGLYRTERPRHAAFVLMRSGSAVLLRSLMFVPGHRPRMLDRALGLGEFPASNLDVAILDLEDGVPLAEKESARATIAAALKRATAGPGRYVRLNAPAAVRAVVVAAVAAGKAAIDGIWPDIEDAGGLERDARTARRLGFSGKSLIHPGQIASVNEIFSPSASEVEHARRVVAAFDEAMKGGDG